MSRKVLFRDISFNRAVPGGYSAVVLKPITPL